MAFHEPCLLVLLPKQCQMVFNKKVNKSEHREEVRGPMVNWFGNRIYHRNVSKSLFLRVFYYFPPLRNQDILIFAPLGLETKIWTRGSTKKQDSTSIMQTLSRLLSTLYRLE